MWPSQGQRESSRRPNLYYSALHIVRGYCPKMSKKFSGSGSFFWFLTLLGSQTKMTKKLFPELPQPRFWPFQSEEWGGAGSGATQGRSDSEIANSFVELETSSVLRLLFKLSCLRWSAEGPCLLIFPVWRAWRAVDAPSFWQIALAHPWNHLLIPYAFLLWRSHASELK